MKYSLINLYTELIDNYSNIFLDDAFASYIYVTHFLLLSCTKIFLIKVETKPMTFTGYRLSQIVT